MNTDVKANEMMHMITSRRFYIYFYFKAYTMKPLFLITMRLLRNFSLITLHLSVIPKKNQCRYTLVKPNLGWAIKKYKMTLEMF